MAKKPINVKEIRRVLRHIKADMRRFRMDYYGIKKGTDAGRTENNFAPCGTRGCFGGWVVLKNTPKKDWAKLFDRDGDMKFNVGEKARRIIGFTENEATNVFVCSFSGQDTPRNQFRDLKKAINLVLANRGMKERV